MANKKHVVKLSDEECERLGVLISKGKAAAKTILKARILLKADASEAGKVGLTLGSARRSTPTSTW